MPCKNKSVFFHRTLCKRAADVRGLTRWQNNDSREHGGPADAFQALDKNSVLGDSAAARLRDSPSHRERNRKWP